MPGKSQTQQHEETLSIDLALPPMTLNLPPLHAHSPTAAPPSVIAVDLALPKPEPALQAVNLTLPASAPAPVAHLSPRIEKRQYKTYQVCSIFEVFLIWFRLAPSKPYREVRTPLKLPIVMSSLISSVLESRKRENNWSSRELSWMVS